MSNNFCGKCGSRIEENSKFCMNCGNRFELHEEMKTYPVNNAPVIGAGLSQTPPEKAKKSSKKAVIITLIISVICLIGAGVFFALNSSNSSDSDSGNNGTYTDNTDGTAYTDGNSSDSDSGNNGTYTDNTDGTAYTDGNSSVVFNGVSITSHSQGDIIEFGSYPQTQVSDGETISALNSLAPSWSSWTSYGYYTGTGDTGTMTQGDWMRYTDVVYNGSKYRGVKFTQYRPYWTYYQSPSADDSYQFENGYITNTVYWFKYEAVKWRVLDPSTGLVMCETIIDSQPYSNTIYYAGGEYFNNSSYTNYASDYETSSIRKWLNDDFYNTAFTDSEKKEISTTVLNNDGYYTLTGRTGCEYLDSNSTNDKIFLLSYNEVKNTANGFSSDSTREAQGSDYAKCQGLYVSSYSGNSYWLLRSPGGYSNYCCYVYSSGYCSSSYDVFRTSNGVRPALKFNLTSEIF